MIRHLTLSLATLSILVAAPAEDKTDFKKVFKGVSLETSLSNMNVETKELVYVPAGYVGVGRKISELTWEANDVKLLGLKVGYDVSDKINLFFSLKKNITDDGTMEDWDWADNANPDVRTHWSYHDNTKVDDITILDFGFTHDIDFEKISTWVGLGYKIEKMEFKAYDGYGNYEGVPVAFSGLGITFEQEYKGPYVELGGDYKYKDISFFLSARYSPMMSVEYTDRHHLRVPAFTEVSNFDDTSMMGFKLASSYAIDKHQSVKLEYEYNAYDYERGGRIRSVDDGTVYNWEDSAAMESKNSAMNLSYNYQF